ncbi:3-dehydroquinate synthase [Pyruvatibacter sp.]|uniref:3-dehydroquinate synthase n=1 Tax=Pyruvatibacter sp. TaxID=1981328 RepID=UPI0032EFFD40
MNTPNHTAHAAKADTVPVSLGDRSYDVRIGSGLLQAAAGHIQPLLKRPFVLIVTDATVAALHLEPLTRALNDADIKTLPIVLPAGEATKSFAHLEDLLSQLIDAGVERTDMIIALGGGVIGDLAGFAAAILRRGVDFIQIPTTLLAQVDSSVGGKTAIDMAQGKNLVGAFHQPRLVLADIDVLATLDKRELRAGYAEVVKYGLIDDPEFFAWLETNGAQLLDGDTDTRIQAVRRSIAAKARVVAADEREGGQRALLNLGHTFGHALETAAGYSGDLLHGEAVAAGMGIAFDVSVHLGFCPADDAERAKAHLRASGLPAGITDLEKSNRLKVPDADDLIRLMGQDKKVSGGKITFILARGIGQSFIAPDIDMEKVAQVLSNKEAA